jgi:hypothetical protein
MSAIEQQFNINLCRRRGSLYQHRKPATDLTLQETIAYLNSKVLLNFKALDTRYVTVSVLNKTFSVCGIVSNQDSQATLPGATVALTTVPTEP